MTAVRVLSAGVDTVHLSAAGELQDGILVCFRSMLELSPESSGPIAFSFGDPDRPEFVLRRYGHHRQPVWLSSPRFEVFLISADMGASAAFRSRLSAPARTGVRWKVMSSARGFAC